MHNLTVSSGYRTVTETTSSYSSYNSISVLPFYPSFTAPPDNSMSLPSTDYVFYSMTTSPYSLSTFTDSTFYPITTQLSLLTPLNFITSFTDTFYLWTSQTLFLTIPHVK